MLLLFIAQIGCSLSEFDCGNGVCIPFSWRCDTDNDCNPAGPSIDEQNCKSTIPMVCCAHVFQLKGHATLQYFGNLRHTLSMKA